MGQLHIYLLRQLIWWTVGVAASLTCIVWLTQSLRFVDMIVNRGLSVTTFITFTLLLLPTFLSLIGPIALFAAIMFTYNRMVSDNEIVVLRASGMKPSAIGRPALILTVVLVAMGYLNSLYLMPSTFREFKDMQREFRTELSSIFLQEGVFNPVVDGITVFIHKRGNNGELFGIIVHDERKPEKPVTVMAEKGAIVASEKGPRVLMINGNRQEVAADDGRLSLLYFERYTFDLSTLNKADIDLWREPRERFLSELFFPSEQADQLFQYRKLRMEGIFRLSSPLLYLAFASIALAMLLGGEFNRRGQFKRIFFAVCAVLIVQVSVLGLKSLGEKIPQTESAMYALPALTAIVFFALMARNASKRRPRRTEEAPA